MSVLEVSKLESLEADQLVTGATDPLDKFGCFFFVGLIVTSNSWHQTYAIIHNLLTSIWIESMANSECHMPQRLAVSLASIA